ncbi:MULTISPECIES: hypothetical protein [Helicobacter]|nr:MULTISPECIES: hypothetical protein [Helicobacter]MDY5950386.1 hypothetical protein [Helicobacter sp.]
MIDKANLKFAKTYDKQDTNRKNPDYTNACLNLYDSQELMQEIARILDQIYLDDAMFSKEYKKRYKDTMQKYRKHCK